MASISFTDYSTVIPASWLNDVNTLTYTVWNGVSTIGQARNALGLGSDVTKTLSLAGNLATSGAYNLTLTLTGATNVTLPTTGTVATTSNKLSAFAATTSAELAGVISDETGSGALVFANTPTLVTPNIGAATGTSLTTTGVQACGDGTVSAPGMAFGSDLNNGFYRIGTDNWAAATAGAKAMEFHSGGQVTTPLNPNFFAYNSSTRNNQTGDGSWVKLPFDTEDYDTGSCFDNSTDTFTAPVSGVYMLSFVAMTVNWGGSLVDIVARVVTSNATIYCENPYIAAGLGFNSFSTQFSVPVYMDAGDTAYIEVYCIKVGNSKTVGIYGQSNARYTWFSGALIG